VVVSSLILKNFLHLPKEARFLLALYAKELLFGGGAGNKENERGVKM
jgi:hypothetical protein